MEKIQKILAKLYTNEIARTEFLQNADKFLYSHELTSEEVGMIKKISAFELQQFSSSLLRKRFSQTQKLLPLSSCILGEKGFLLFEEFAQSYTPKGVRKHFCDAKKFALFLVQKEQNKIIRKIFLYEKTNLEFWNSRFFFV